MDLPTNPDAIRNPVDGCADAYNDFFHKIRADIGFDRWRAIWHFINRRIVTEDTARHADIGAMIEGGMGPVDPSQHELVFLKLAAGTGTPEVLADLQRIGEAISSGEKIGVVQGEAGIRMARIARLVTEKFASGNSVPVERITLTRAEVGLGAPEVQP